MGLSVEEQEIHISKMRNDNEFIIYVSDRTYKTKLDKIVKPYKIDKDLETGEEIAWHYKLNKKQISFRKNIGTKRQMTEEEREKARIRLQTARENRNNKNVGFIDTLDT